MGFFLGCVCQGDLVFLVSHMESCAVSQASTCMAPTNVNIESLQQVFKSHFVLLHGLGCTNKHVNPVREAGNCGLVASALVAEDMFDKVIYLAGLGGPEI